MKKSVLRGLTSKPVIFLSAYLVFLAFSLEVSCQFLRVPQYTFEVGGIGSIGRQAPFWLVSNNFGKYAAVPVSGFLSAKLNSEIDSSKKIAFAYELEAFGRLDSESSLYFHQANVRLNIWFMHLRLGSKEDTYGNQHGRLSSGSLLWSENTRPMPKIVLATNGFVDVPFTKGYGQFSGHFSHGWFGDNGYVKDAYLHHKDVFVKAGGNLPVNISMGLQHYAVWGGVSPDPAIGALPSDFDAFTRVLFSKKGEDTIAGIPLNESLNKIGNHLGSWQYKLDVKLNRYLLGIYYQTIFEDYSGFSNFFMSDGLWGISLETKDSKKLINAFTYEYIHTTYQSGPPEALNSAKTKGNDNFFNNSIYKSGWTYNHFTIGTPIISSPSLIEGGAIYITNNRVIAHHFGLQGETSNSLAYRMLLTFSRNYGVYDYAIPFPESKPVQSILLEISKPIQKFRGLDLLLKVAADYGELYGNNAGVFIAFRKSGGGK